MTGRGIWAPITFDEKIWLSRKDIRANLGYITNNWLHELERLGELRTIHTPGGHTRYRKVDIIEWFATHKMVKIAKQKETWAKKNGLPPPDECTNPVWARGLCNAHYKQWRAASAHVQDGSARIRPYKRRAPARPDPPPA